MADEVQRRIAADGLDDLRMADGVVFQHLVPGPQPIGELAARVGAGEQAASKSVADLERRGYVRRGADPPTGDLPRRADRRGEAAIAPAAATAPRSRRSPPSASAPSRGGRPAHALDVLDALGGAARSQPARRRPA